MNLDGFSAAHLGGHRTVTGSCHLVRLRGLHLLVDCGLAQGGDSVLPMDQWPVPPSRIDYVLLTHAHLDHVGRLPDLLDAGFRGEILATHATKALLAPMLEDALGFTHRSRERSRKLLDLLDELSWGFEYGETFHLKKGVKFRLGRAGHILGSAFVRLEWGDAPCSAVFSGDLGACGTPLLPDPDPPEPCRLLFLESTYGDRLHEDRKARADRLGRALVHALADGGKVFVPAFALGRTQELLYELDRLFSEPRLKEAFPELQGAGRPPVFIDSPLGLRITDIYASLGQFWDREARDLLRRGDHPLHFEGLYGVRDHRDHLHLVDSPGPAVVVAGSGMCTGGRVVDHLAKGLDDPRNDVLFVGYQAAGTPGRDILRYGERPDGYAVLDGRRVPIRARVRALGGYSAHADRSDLLRWVESMGEKPGKIRLIHGEDDARRALGRELERRGYSCEA